MLNLNRIDLNFYDWSLIVLFFFLCLIDKMNEFKELWDSLQKQMTKKKRENNHKISCSPGLLVGRL